MNIQSDVGDIFGREREEIVEEALVAQEA